MKIVAHRGFWKDASEKNSSISFERASSFGFGIETDFRDFNGELVVSHDVPKLGDRCLLAGKLLEKIRFCKDRPVAVNIKADGLGHLLRRAFEGLNSDSWFCFDGSIPDSIHLLNMALPVFFRISEFEDWSDLYLQGQGIWLDQFNSEWISKPYLIDLSRKVPSICVVSPELHGREFREFWFFLKEISIRTDCNWMICTDHPLEAREFFHG